MIGRTISHFEVLEKLGEGGMGVVYKARDLVLGRMVALKVLLARQLADPERRRSFIQEARAASALNHPNIVTIYEISESDGVDFIAMELIQGKTLTELTRGKGLRLEDALHYGVQMADALSKAHLGGIIHRDLKPANVMVTPDGLVKILDFGLAKLTEPAPGGDSEAATAPPTEIGTVMGTAAYMSPEQGEGKPVDRRSDIFAFGAVMYEMLSGKRAFVGDTPVATLAEVLHHDPKPLREVAAGTPPELERVITRCLRKNPERRFHNMADVRVALQELKEETQSGVTATGPAAVTRRRSPRLLGAAALVLLALAAAGVWSFRVLDRRRAVPMRVIPFTTYRGREFLPSFSPDGSQVAFCWDGEKQDNYDLYVKSISTGAQLRLTNTPTWEFGAAWSPDGRYLAFMRVEMGLVPGVFLVSPLGGPERKVGQAFWPTMAWSPDSRWLAVVDSEGPQLSIFILSIDSGQKRKITSPPAGLADMYPAFSGDGRTLAFSRASSPTSADLFVVGLSGDGAPEGEPHRLTADSAQNNSPVWTADGREILFCSTRSGSPSLWRMPVSHSGSAWRAGEPERLAVGEGATSVAASHQARRLVYTKSLWDRNIWRARLDGSEPAALIASTQQDSNPKYSPDGRRIAFASDRSGNWEIWRCDAEGAGCVQLTSLGAPFVGTPQWSPDGRLLVFSASSQGSRDIYVISAEGGQPQRLVADSSDDESPNWSRDGQWIYFASNRSGTFEVWKIPAAGGNPAQVTTKGGCFAAESADGLHLYYAKGRGTSLLWRRPGPKGPPGEETPMPAVLQTAPDFEVVPEGIYYMPEPFFLQRTGLPVQFFDLAARTAKPLFTPEKTTTGGLSVSPGRRWILYTQIDRQESDLLLVENFR